MKSWAIFTMICTMLIGCASTPKVWNASGEKYARETEVAYSGIEVSVYSDKEEKSVRAGYMSNMAVQEYMEAKLLEQLEALNMLDPDGLVLDVDMDISRVFSWGGDSMASINYVARTDIKRGTQVMGQYSVGGQVADNSIAGNFKTIFSKNDPSDEGRYFDYMASQVIARLPK